MKLRIIAITAVIILLITALVACGDDPVVTTPATTTPTPTTPAPTTPAVTTPVVTTPVVTTPIETTPVPTTPVVTTPVATTPAPTTPVVTPPFNTDPVTTTPVATTPVATTPVVTTPVITTPVVTTPVVTTPVVTTPVVTTPVTTTPVVTDQNMKNPMTGEASDKDYSSLRPVAIFISNQTSVIGKQYGISEADVIYEFLAEGGVTRLLMLTYDYDSSVQYGPVRSARDYALDFALMHDAISIHAGGSFESYLKISAAALDTIDGTNNAEAAEYFYYVSQGLPSYNSYMINGSDIARAIRSVRGVYNNALARLNSSAAATSYFKFADDGKFTGGTGDSNKISITYLASSFGSSSGVTSLTYNSADGKYYKFVDDVPQTDANNEKQLAFENVLILKTKTTRISSSVISIDITTGGSGYYCNGGKYITIYWTYNADTAQIALTSTSGEALEMATGKTLVSIVSNESVGVPSLVEFQ